MLAASKERTLSIPLIDSTGILLQPLSNWHHLYDATGTIAESVKWGYKGEKAVISTFSMGECSIREGCPPEKRYESEFALDKKYFIRSIEGADSANIQIDGFVTETVIDKIEYFGSSSKVPAEHIITSTGEFPVYIIYGMAAAAAAVAVMILFWSDRKLKKIGRASCRERV